MRAVYRISKSVNVFFHPILFPLYAFLLLYFFSNVIWFFVNDAQFIILLTFIAVTAVVIPMVCFFLIKKISKVRNIVRNTKYHALSFCVLFEAMVYVAISYSMMKIEVPRVLSDFFMVSAMALILLSIISLFVTLDFHSISLGTLTGMFVHMLTVGMTNNHTILIILILLVGMVGTSRILIHKEFTFLYHLGALLGVCFGFAASYFLFG